MALRIASCLATLAVAASLVACGKAGDTPPGQAKAQEPVAAGKAAPTLETISGGNGRFTATDTQGRTVAQAQALATVAETELGVAIFPGATALPMSGTRMQLPEGTTVTAAYNSAEGLDKVTAFYREQLRTQAAGKQLHYEPGANGAGLTLIDEQAGTSVQVVLNAVGTGTSIQIVAVRPGTK